MSIANAARADAHTRLNDTRRGAVPDARQGVCVLDADPDLAVGLDQNQIQSARRHSVARVMYFERGPFSFRSADEGLGALILEGLILVRVEFAGIRANVELLGPGDVISPWLGMGTAPTPPCRVTARVLTRLGLALLDRDFALRTARYPEIHSALMRRLVVRSRMLSMQSAINSLPRIEERVELTLWQLAYRFGHVSRDGIKLDLPLAHSQLAEMVCAQRPSVSTALTRLRNRGRIAMSRRHQWLLLGSPPPQLVGTTEDLAGI
jgi:CRP/FNR family transcriptional regulator, cyclic AMP receptor protein